MVEILPIPAPWGDSAGLELAKRGSIRVLVHRGEIEALSATMSDALLLMKGQTASLPFPSFRRKVERFIWIVLKLLRTRFSRC
jgi:hypothetical protein